jgi:hypothetical protein
MIRYAAVAFAAIGVAGLAGSSAQASWTVDLGQTQITNPAYSGTVKVTFANASNAPGNSSVVITIDNQATSTNFHLKRFYFNLEDSFFANFAASALSLVVNEGPDILHFFAGQNTQFLRPSGEAFDAEIWYVQGDDDAGGFAPGISKFTITNTLGVLDETDFQARAGNGEFPNLYGGIHYGLNNTQSGKSGGVDFIEGPGGGVEAVVPVPASVIGLMIAGAFLLVFRGNLGIA